jgi:hypothetical protein
MSIPSTPHQRGCEQGRRDSGKRYTGGTGSGYASAKDRDAYRAGYEAGWGEGTPDPVLVGSAEAGEGVQNGSGHFTKGMTCEKCGAEIGQPRPLPGMTTLCGWQKFCPECCADEVRLQQEGLDKTQEEEKARADRLWGAPRVRNPGCTL